MTILVALLAAIAFTIATWAWLRTERLEAEHQVDAALWQTIQDKLLRHEQRLDERRMVDTGTKRTRRKEA